MAQPRAYTPNHLVQKILASRGSVEGERKQVTVFFADVKESMRLAARVGAEEWHRILDRFFAILADGIHRFEGTINQFTGDGVMALFGAPIAHEDHAQRACHAALHVREELRRFARELRRTRKLRFAVRMGLNSGEVVVGAIGDDLRMDYTAQGHTVGLAARMQQIARAGTIYVAPDTAALVSAFFRLEPVGAVRVKGVRRPVRTFALAGSGPVRTRIEASRARGFSPFVGRADEIASLEAALGHAVSGYGQVVAVVGPPGVGKSRLCQEAVDRWRAEGLVVAEAHCPAHGRSLPGAALTDLLRSLFALAPGESPPTSRRRIRTRLRGLPRGVGDGLAVVLEALGVPDPKQRLPALDAEARREQLSTFVCRLVQALGARTPIVLLLDDVQWIDAESAAFLERLVDAVGWTRTLLLLNWRSDHTVDWLQAPYCQRLDLAPLGADATDALVRKLVGDDPTLAAVCSLVGERAGGNPFFVEEIVQSLVDEGVLQRVRRALRLARPVSELRIPPTVQSLVAARIDSLPEAAKHVLQAAAVIGKRFSEPLLRLTLGGDVDVAPALRTLEHDDLVRAEAQTAGDYTFRHPLTQEVAYQTQLLEKRTRGHEAVARALTAVHAHRLGEQASLLAYHWEAAGKRYEAQRWRRRAALHVTHIEVGRTRRP